MQRHPDHTVGAVRSYVPVMTVAVTLFILLGACSSGATSPVDPAASTVGAASHTGVDSSSDTVSSGSGNHTVPDSSADTTTQHDTTTHTAPDTTHARPDTSADTLSHPGTDTTVTDTSVTDTSATDTTSANPPSSSALASECSAPKPGWIFCDDFETNRMSSYFEVDSANGNFVRLASVGVDGSSGMRVHFAAGQVSAGSLKLAFGRTPTSYFRPVDAGTANYREIYWRVYVRNQAGWQGGGGDKLSRAQIIANSNWAQAMGAPVWSGGQSSNWNYLLIDPYSGVDDAGTLKTTTYNDFANLRWLGSAQSTTPIFDASHVGQWYCVEAHVRLNDAGQSNGVFELWINGVSEASRTGLNWVGNFSDYGINTVFLENYWNDGSPVAQDRYLDNFVVSTSRIGCG